MLANSFLDLLDELFGFTDAAIDKELFEFFKALVAQISLLGLAGHSAIGGRRAMEVIGYLL